MSGRRSCCQVDSVNSVEAWRAECGIGTGVLKVSDIKEDIESVWLHSETHAAG